MSKITLRAVLMLCDEYGVDPDIDLSITDLAIAIGWDGLQSIDEWCIEELAKLDAK